jgi:hypothetical protein
MNLGKIKMLALVFLTLSLVIVSYCKAACDTCKMNTEKIGPAGSCTCGDPNDPNDSQCHGANSYAYIYPCAKVDCSGSCTHSETSAVWVKLASIYNCISFQGLPCGDHPCYVSTKIEYGYYFWVGVCICTD